MTTYNTGNPIGSTDARDLYDNAENLDHAVNSNLPAFTDRLGVSRRTFRGIEDSAAVVLAGLGYAVPVPYTAGISLTLPTQTVEYSGEVYAPVFGALPFTTSGVFESANFRLIQGLTAGDMASGIGASLVGYTPAGAVPTDVQSKLRESVSVKDFGAVGDGVTDDTVAIQAALDAGRWVFLPRGIYRTTSELVIKKNSGLIGESANFWQFNTNKSTALANSSTIYYDGVGGTNSAVIRCSAEPVGVLPAFTPSEATNLQNVCIQNLLIDGNNKAEFGLYVARAGLGNIYQNVCVTGTKRRGFFFGELFTNSVGPLTALFNYGTGGSIGENLFGWSTGNIVNACEFDTLLAFKNGRDAGYNETSAPTDGVGWVINCNRTNTFTNVIAELNYGAGVYLSPRTGPNYFRGLYLEDNCYFDPATDAASEVTNALTAGKATLPWGMVGYNRKVSADTIQVFIEGVFGASVGGAPRYQHMRLTGDASGGFVQEPGEPWVFRGVFGIRTIDSGFYNYAVEFTQRALVDSDPASDLTRCLPAAGTTEGVVGSVTTLFVGNTAMGDKSGRTAGNRMLFTDAMRCARVCSGVTTIDVSAMTSAGNPAFGLVADGAGFTRRFTISGGAAGRFNYGTSDNVALYARNWQRTLTVSGMAVLERTLAEGASINLLDCPIIRTGGNSDARAAIVATRASVNVSGTSVINVSNSTATTKIGVGLDSDSSVSFNSAAAGTIAGYTAGNAIHFNNGSGIVRVSLTTATATWAAAANVARNAGGGGGMVFAPDA
jgi:hypothetical protein